MNENPKETFLTTLKDENQISSYDFNDDDMHIDSKSSTDSEDIPRTNTEIKQILNKKDSYEKSSLLISHVQSINDIENQR